MMLHPDQRLYDDDLAAAEFRAGAARGYWGLPDPAEIPSDLTWPRCIHWIAAATRDNAPDRYYFLLDGTGYRGRPPTGTLWDPTRQMALEPSKRPKGRPGSRFAMVFRTDWHNGTAFYHPYDRVAADSHDKWGLEQPHLVWTPQHTIVDFLEEFHGLLQSRDYLGG